jgi:hypothetical protein
VTGRLERNRCSYVKNPRTGKRIARPNSRDSWDVIELLELRIVDEDLWNRVKARLKALGFDMQLYEEGRPLNRAHRRRFLLSGLLKCGLCRGGYTIVAKDRYGCTTHRTKGTCSNGATVTRQEIEARVLMELKEKLMAPKLVREFVRKFQEEVNRLQAERQQQAAAKRARLAAA